jgi:hypothetical protein
MTPGWEGALKILLRTFIFEIEKKNSPSWTDAFLFGKWIEISDGQRFSIVVNVGNGPDC